MIDVEKESLCINNIVGEKSFQIEVQGDSIIPDTKPDILKDITWTGNVCIYKREVLDKKIRLDGSVNLYIMYLADGEEKKVRGFNAEVDFTEILDFEEAMQQMVLDEEIKIKQVECKVLNGRKVNFDVTLDVTAKLFLNTKGEIIKKVNNVDDIQSQTIKLNINSLVRTKFDKRNGKRGSKNR